ncbi:helix-turn-helix transcriptional regulator [Streptomyces tremellae]|uniref:Helix-turn-helix transcriptional regulator n=1 Tax=Streptomyces tremellae TaxID=1124239 RepID=A0ABP7E996_9ACTN
MTEQSEHRAVDPKAELTEFLRTRRARLKPCDVGLPDIGRHRRVPGLRREELAQLAGVSVAYYTRLEQGNAQNVSAGVLEAIARALRLSPAETQHLMHVAKPKRHGRKKVQVLPQHPRAALGALLESMQLVPAYVLGNRTDILAWNRLAAAVFHDFTAVPEKHRNYARLVFLDPAMRTLFADWEAKAAETASSLRMYAGYCPDDPDLSALVGELSVKSDDFRRLWAAHEVPERSYGRKRLDHPLVGELELSYESLKLPDDPGQTLLLYHAEPGSPSAESLRLLASWGADASRAGVVAG